MRTIRNGMPWALTMLAVLCPALTGPALAGDLKRVALVVGNGGYDPADISRLDNPVNDARLLARTLERVDFEVSLVTDAGQDAMKRAIKSFGKRLRAAGRDAVGLFYYAGHGVESGGSNYLIPLGAEVESEMDLASDAVPAQWVLARMEAAGNRLNMVILDACRNNPYPGRVRGGTRGLARMDAPSGSFVAYSAAPGQTATDGDGENSPYALALANALVEPGLTVERVFKRVRVQVEEETERTGRKQTPWDSSSLKGDFFFVPPREADGVGDEGRKRVEANEDRVKVQDKETEREFWVSIKGSRNPAKFRAYLNKYGEDGEFSGLARIELEELEGSVGAAAARPSQTPRAPGVYLTAGVSAGQRILPRHLKAVGTSRIPDGDIGGYSMVAGGCFTGSRAEGARLEWSDVAASCNQ